MENVCGIKVLWDPAIISQKCRTGISQELKILNNHMCNSLLYTSKLLGNLNRVYFNHASEIVSMKNPEINKHL